MNLQYEASTRAHPFSPMQSITCCPTPTPIQQFFNYWIFIYCFPPVIKGTVRQTGIFFKLLEFQINRKWECGEFTAAINTVPDLMRGIQGFQIIFFGNLSTGTCRVNIPMLSFGYLLLKRLRWPNTIDPHISIHRPTCIAQVYSVVNKRLHHQQQNGFFWHIFQISLSTTPSFFATHKLFIYPRKWLYVRW